MDKCQWEIVWTKIGWVNPNTKREGWAIVDTSHDEDCRTIVWY